MNPEVASLRPFFMTSHRLGFGVWRAQDVDLASAIWGDNAVTRWTGGPSRPIRSRRDCPTEISNQIEHQVQYWPIFHLDTGDHLGCCGLRPRDADAGVLELGYQLRPGAWGRGYASEAARAVIDWAAAKGVRALFAGHHPSNAASRRILLGLGFAYAHDEFLSATGQVEPCYRLQIAALP